MSRSILVFMILLMLPGIACADRYEVIPRWISKVNSPPGTGYSAFILDNTAGLVVSCGVIIRSNGIQPVTCEKRLVSFAISPSADLKSIRQSYQAPLGNMSELPGVWQINSSSGDLQFCLMADLPTGSCVQIDWRSAKPPHP